MSSTLTPKKQLPPGNVRSTTAAPSSTSNTPSRSPTRATGPITSTPKTTTPATAVGGAPGLNRARSVRTAAPASARAAVKKSGEIDPAAEDIKAEMQAKLEELQQQLLQAEKMSEDAHKQASMLQLKLDEALKEQGILEETMHEQAERLEELDNAKKETERAKRELEQIYETERVATMKEREATQMQHEEFESAMQRMKESLAQREMRAGLDEDRRASPTRGSHFRNGGTSPGPEGSGQFAPPSSLQRSDSRSSSKLLIQKDKIIESLRMEVAESQIKIVEMENMGGGQLQQIQRQLYEVKIQNARLMEENESFQLLLSEKTLNGDLAQSDLLTTHTVSESPPPSRLPDRGSSLADELGSDADFEALSAERDRKLQAEVGSLKDQNRALTLYINNIISRLLQHEQFEQILDKTPDLMSGPNAANRRMMEGEKDLPPPPLPKEGSQEDAPSFLNRARSVMSRTGMRPLSFNLASDQSQTASAQASLGATRVNENPATAPSIPLGRSTSVRAPGGHKRSSSDWNAMAGASNLYRGPSPGLQGPTSPISATANARMSFIASQSLNERVTSAGSTFGSGSAITESDFNKENTSQRDSKVSNRNSMTMKRQSFTSNPSSNNMLDASDAYESGVSDFSNPSSPPRSTASVNDKDSKPSGAIMMGSKMRPLRLVQESSKENEAATKQANRASWLGFLQPARPGPPSMTRQTSGDGV